MEISKVAKGQITIPKSIREGLGLSGGDEVAFDVDNGKVSLIPVWSRTVEDLRGALQTDEPITDLKRARKGYTGELAQQMQRETNDEE